MYKEKWELKLAHVKGIDWWGWNFLRIRILEGLQKLWFKSADKKVFSAPAAGWYSSSEHTGTILMLGKKVQGQLLYLDRVWG